MTKRTETYTRRHWRCERCGAHGLVLIHIADTPEKANRRREQSHQAQRRRDACPNGKYLLWYTTSQELDAEEARLAR